jgi:hypothetical protein
MYHTEYGRSFSTVLDARARFVGGMYIAVVGKSVCGGLIFGWVESQQVVPV